MFVVCFRRTLWGQRGKTKLNDVAVLRDIRQTEVIYSFGGRDEFKTRYFQCFC